MESGPRGAGGVYRERNGISPRPDSALKWSQGEFCFKDRRKWIYSIEQKENQLQDADKRFLKFCFCVFCHYWTNLPQVVTDTWQLICQTLWSMSSAAGSHGDRWPRRWPRWQSSGLNADWSCTAGSQTHIGSVWRCFCSTLGSKHVKFYASQLEGKEKPPVYWQSCDLFTSFLSRHNILKISNIKKVKKKTFS